MGRIFYLPDARHPRYVIGYLLAKVTIINEKTRKLWYSRGQWGERAQGRRAWGSINTHYSAIEKRVFSAEI